MPDDISQEDIDKLLEEALGGPAPSFDDEPKVDDDATAAGDADGVGPGPAGSILGGSAEGPEDSAPAVEGSGDVPLDGLEPGGGQVETGGAQSQDDIDALLSGALDGQDDRETAPPAAKAGGGEEPPSEAPAAEPGEGPQSQDDIDALLAGALDGGSLEKEASAPEAEPKGDGGSAQSQDDIDALLSDALGAGGGEEVRSPAAAPAPEAGGGAQSQDDIDALLAGALGGGGSEEAAGAEPAAAAEEGGGAVQSQDDIDALLSSALGGGEAEPVSESPPAEGGAQSQDDVDALLQSALGGDGTASQEQGGVDALLSTGSGAEAEAPSESQSQDDIDSLLSDALGRAPEDLTTAGASADEAAAEVGADGVDALLSEDEESASAAPDDEGEDDAGIDALLAGLEDTGSADGSDESEGDDAAETTLAGKPVVSERATETELPAITGAEARGTREADIPVVPAEQDGDDDILASALGDEPSPAESVPETKQVEVSGGAPPDTVVRMEEGLASAEAAAARTILSPPAERAPQAPPVPHAEEGHAPASADEHVARVMDSLRLVDSGSEIEGITGEIAGLLGQLAERARRHEHSAETRQHEINDLRAKVRAAERRADVLGSEKQVLEEELLEVRSRLSAHERDHLQAAEARQAEIASLQVGVRERDGRIRQLEGQVESLNLELGELRQNLTEMEVSCRKAQFEQERARNDLEAERQERARLHRALEAREKELQAIQAHASGEASTLFIDELHRLVRRYESELNACTGAARDALAALERIPADGIEPRLYQMLVDGVRSAAGLQRGGDTLGAISRETSPPVAAGEEAEGAPLAGLSLDELGLDLQALELKGAAAKVSGLLARKLATPAQVMETIYQADALRSPRVANQMPSLVGMLSRIREAQTAADQVLGHESPETDRLYVQIFDLLHQLVRVKAVSKATPGAWQFFLDVRGRYSFITSDAQWSGYRDKVLGGG